jgi:hypothetical protein
MTIERRVADPLLPRERLCWGGLQRKAHRPSPRTLVQLDQFRRRERISKSPPQLGDDPLDHPLDCAALPGRGLRKSTLAVLPLMQGSLEHSAPAPQRVSYSEGR